MDTRKIASEYRSANWAQVMRERKESGQTIKEYCKNAGITEHAYYYWHKKLRKEACKKLSEMQNPHSQTALDMPRFAEVKLGYYDRQLANSYIAQPSQICVEITGIKITADNTYPENKLAYLLRELVK